MLTDLTPPNDTFSVPRKTNVINFSMPLRKLEVNYRENTSLSSQFNRNISGDLRLRMHNDRYPRYSAETNRWEAVLLRFNKLFEYKQTGFCESVSEKMFRALNYVRREQCTLEKKARNEIFSSKRCHRSLDCFAH